MNSLEELKNLVNITNEELKDIHENINNSKNIELLDYINCLNLNSKEKEILLNNKKISSERTNLINKYKKIILSSRTLNQKMTMSRINNKTEFENEPTLFFGVGGGSKELCKGLPFDILSMILTGENIRKNLNIKTCYILLANRITYTNIPKNKEFSKESIDNVMNTERKIIELVLKKFRISEHWKVIMQTELDKFLSKEDYCKYEEIIQLADKSTLVGGHHYSIEMADIYAMVGRNSGGIKLGWFIRNVDKKNGGYIMDEQPFHARFVLFCAKENIKNKVSLAYAMAGARLYRGTTGMLEKSSPYICYFPEKRILLSPFEDAIKKMEKATNNGDGLKLKYIRTFYSGIIDLFENIVLGKTNDIVNRIPTNKQKIYENSEIAEKMQYILDYIFHDNINEMKKIWLEGFNYIGEDYKGGTN